MRGPRAVPDARRGHAEAWGRLSRRSSAAAATPTWACRSPRAGTRRRACQDPKPSNQAQGGVPLTETRRNALLKLSFSTAILSTSLDFFAFNAFAQSLGILETRKAELKVCLRGVYTDRERQRQREGSSFPVLTQGGCHFLLSLRLASSHRKWMRHWRNHPKMRWRC